MLIITDAGIHKLGLTDRLEKVLTDSSIPYILYDKTVANPTTVNVAEALELYHENNCQAIIENMTGKLDHGISLFLFCRKSEGD